MARTTNENSTQINTRDCEWIDHSRINTPVRYTVGQVNRDFSGDVVTPAENVPYSISIDSDFSSYPQIGASVSESLTAAETAIREIYSRPTPYGVFTDYNERVSMADVKTNKAFQVTVSLAYENGDLASVYNIVFKNRSSLSFIMGIYHSIGIEKARELIIETICKRHKMISPNDIDIKFDSNSSDITASPIKCENGHAAEYGIHRKDYYVGRCKHPDCTGFVTFNKNAAK